MLALTRTGIFIIDFVVRGGAKRCAQTLRHTASTEEKEKDWAALDLKTLLSGLDKRALASMRAPS